MQKNLELLISQTKYFSDNNIKILDIQELAKDKYKILTDREIYELLIMDKDAKLDLFNELNHEKLETIGTKPKHSYELGIFNDIEKAYLIRQYQEEISLREFLNISDEKTIYKKAVDFGKILRNLHDLDLEKDVNWYKFFKTKSNYLFYMHGINEVGDDDYILTDYISGHKHLTKNIEPSYLYRNLDLDNIFITDDGDFHLEGLGFNVVGDRVFDFTQINSLALVDKDFSSGVIDGYFQGKKPPIKFYRLLALYQSYQILDALVKNRGAGQGKLSEDEIAGLLDMYDNFNVDIPDWI